MATHILAYKKHSLAWYYENDVTKTDEPQYTGPDNKKNPNQPACLKKLKLLSSRKNAIKEGHKASVRCHNLVLGK